MDTHDPFKPEKPRSFDGTNLSSNLDGFMASESKSTEEAEILETGEENPPVELAPVKLELFMTQIRDEQNFLFGVIGG